MGEHNEHWSRQAWSGLVLLVLIALGARIVYGLLGPLLPFLIVVVVLAVIFRLILRQRH
jgi:uncharacterized membrane protein YfcA